MLSQVIPFIEILKMELGSTGDDDGGIISTEEEMLKSLKSHFEHVYSDNNCVIFTLLDPRFKATFYDTTATESAVQTLVALCKDCQLPKSRDTQGSQESQQAVGELVECVDSTELSSTDSESSSTETSMINTPEKKKGFSIWESYQKAVKKLKPTSLSHSLSFQEKISAMINDYINEPVTENPKNSRIH